MTSASDHGWVDTSRAGPPPSQTHIDAALAKSLVAAHFPALADADIGDRFDGWDMAVFRVGDGHALRLPRTAAAVTSLAVETRALQHVGVKWSFSRPSIVHVGGPGYGYPWPWVITTWLEGDAADGRPLPATAGGEVGEALAEVHSTPCVDAPFNLEQSITMAERSPLVAWALPIVAEREGPDGQRLSEAAARDVWAEALAAPSPGDAVWSHADCHGSNIVNVEGSFGGLIDWGKMSACDRAVDLAFLTTAMPWEGVERAVATYRDATGVEDAGLEARLRGIALAKAVSWATLERRANVMMAWRAFAALGVVR